MPAYGIGTPGHSTGTGIGDVTTDVKGDDGIDVEDDDGTAMFAVSDEVDDGSTKDAAGVGRDDGAAVNDAGGLGKSGNGGGAYAAAVGFGEAARTGDGTVIVLEISRSAIGDGSKRGFTPM